MSVPRRFEEEILYYWTGWMEHFSVYQAIMGCGGGLAVRLESLLRFWTVAIRRNSSLAPPAKV